MALGTIETDIRKEQHGAEKQWKQTGKDTREQAKNIIITETAETNIRKGQFDREKEFKSTVRDTKEKLKDVNMAAAAFA
jgi:hypothetical protein